MDSFISGQIIVTKMRARHASPAHEYPPSKFPMLTGVGSLLSTEEDEDTNFETLQKLTCACVKFPAVQNAHFKKCVTRYNDAPQFGLRQSRPIVNERRCVMCEVYVDFGRGRCRPPSD